MTMYTLHCSQKTEIIQWDHNSFTDCRPEEADAVADEVIDAAKQAERDFKTSKRSWTLEKANEEAKSKCQSIVDGAMEGYGNLLHAKECWDEYKGMDVSRSLVLDNWGMRKLPMRIARRTKRDCHV